MPRDGPGCLSGRARSQVRRTKNFPVSIVDTGAKDSPKGGADLVETPVPTPAEAYLSLVDLLYKLQTAIARRSAAAEIVEATATIKLQYEVDARRLARHEISYTTPQDETWDRNPRCAYDGRAWPCPDIRDLMDVYAIK